MSRPTKSGIDYFPLDTNFDDKTELLITEKGAISISILITIWQLIYQNEGYYIKADKDVLLLVKKRLIIETEMVEDIIKAAVERGIFDKEKYYNNGILTSKAIQKRYFIAAKKKKIINVVRNYLCDGVSVSENSTYIGINSDGNATKEKEKEKEKEKVECSKNKNTHTKYKEKIKEFEELKKYDIVYYSDRVINYYKVFKDFSDFKGKVKLFIQNDEREGRVYLNPEYEKMRKMEDNIYTFCRKIISKYVKETGDKLKDIEDKLEKAREITNYFGNRDFMFIKGVAKYSLFTIQAEIERNL